MNEFHRQEAGRKRLAMRLPSMRGRIMAAQTASQLALFEAYHLAVIATETFRRDEINSDLVEDYEALCIEIEQDVIRTLSLTN